MVGVNAIKGGPGPGGGRIVELIVKMEKKSGLGRSGRGGGGSEELKLL